MIVNQIHVRHILMKTNELDDDATVREKLGKLRAAHLERRGFRRHRLGDLRGPGLGARRRRSRLDRPRARSCPSSTRRSPILKPNEISEPFKTRYGWHIVQMLGTRTYDSTDDVRRQQAFAAIRESKADEETELWLRRLRDEAFVEIKM